MLMHRGNSNKTKQPSAPERVWTVEQMLEKVMQLIIITVLFWLHLSIVWILVCWKVNGFKNVFTLSSRVIRSSQCELSEGMLPSTVMQWPCNAILDAGPSGQILLASVWCWKDQRSTFSPGLLWKTCEQSGDDSVFIAEGHLHTCLFPLLHCSSQVDLTGRPRPQTSWIMHCEHPHCTACILPCCRLSLLQHSGSLLGRV